MVKNNNNWLSLLQQASNHLVGTGCLPSNRAPKAPGDVAFVTAQELVAALCFVIPPDGRSAEQAEFNSRILGDSAQSLAQFVGRQCKGEPSITRRRFRATLSRLPLCPKEFEKTLRRLSVNAPFAWDEITGALFGGNLQLNAWGIPPE